MERFRTKHISTIERPSQSSDLNQTVNLLLVGQGKSPSHTTEVEYHKIPFLKEKCKIFQSIDVAGWQGQTTEDLQQNQVLERGVEQED